MPQFYTTLLNGDVTTEPVVTKEDFNTWYEEVMEGKELVPKRKLGTRDYRSVLESCDEVLAHMGMTAKHPRGIRALIKEVLNN